MPRLARGIQAPGIMHIDLDPAVKPRGDIFEAVEPRDNISEAVEPRSDG